MQLTLCKDNANREENEINLFISYSEMKLILYKDNANREENEIKHVYFLTRYETYIILPSPQSHKNIDIAQVKETKFILFYIHYY